MLVAITFAVLILSTVITMAWSFFSSKAWNPSGRHCYITGGSAGLGLSLAILLTKRGADVSIVARSQATLDKALEQIEAARVSPNQILKAYSYALDTYAASVEAFDAVCSAHGGKAPDAVFLCAGVARLGFFVEESEEALRRGMDLTYWVSAWTAKVASQRMAQSRSQGKIVFVSSILGYAGLIGYSTYSPGKHALRGLAETLRQELLLYSIDIHIYFPGTIASPGHVEENKTKPQITSKIEEQDAAMTPDYCADGLFKGVERGDFHIADTFNSELFRCSTRGATPYNNILKDLVYGFIGFVGLPDWRRGVDKMVVAHRKDHEAHLASNGFYDSAKP
ncbi:oxidoreductase [Amylostereum chailletii]|nr:oxidoreductase [Amylostereum chailletii]